MKILDCVNLVNNVTFVVKIKFILGEELYSLILFSPSLI